MQKTKPVPKKREIIKDHPEQLKTSVPQRRLVLEYMSPKELTPYVNNPRVISEAGLEKLTNSVKRFGSVSPVIAWIDEKTRVIEIVSGHQRVKAAMRAGVTDVPVIIVPFKNAAEARAYNVTDNRMAELSEWDDTLLSEVLAEVGSTGFDLSVTGFDSFDDSNPAPINPADGTIGLKEWDIGPVRDEFNLVVSGPLPLQGKVRKVLAQFSEIQIRVGNSQQGVD